MSRACPHLVQVNFIDDWSLLRNNKPNTAPSDDSASSRGAAPPPTMLALLPLLSLLSLLTTHAAATALTYKLVPNEKECFFTHIDNPGVKIAFYFAVQTGGSFDSTPSQPGKTQTVVRRVRSANTRL